MGGEIVRIFDVFGSIQLKESVLHLSRPKTIDDVAAQEHTVAVLRRTLTSTNVCFPLL